MIYCHDCLDLFFNSFFQYFKAISTIFFDLLNKGNFKEDFIFLSFNTGYFEKIAQFLIC